MEQIAFYSSGGTAVSFGSILMTLAVGTAACFFLCFYLRREGKPAAAFAVIPLAIGLGLVLARFFHWYSRADGYDGFLAAMTDYAQGGFALPGAFAGCLLAAGVTRALFLHRNLPKMLDCMAVSGCAGIAVGRLGSLFNSSDRGMVVASHTLPIAYPVTNAVSGATEYRLATFLFQAIWALALFALLACLCSGRKKHRDGDIFQLFLLLYGASQIVLDSTRYDSLFFRSNGFVSVVQVLSAILLAWGMVLYSRQAVKKRGFRGWYVPLWILMAASIVGAGFMEYYVQRRGNEALLAYSVMSLCLAAGIGVTMIFRAYSYGRRAAGGKLVTN